MITLRLDRDEVTPHLRRLLKESESDSPLGRVLGRAASNELKKHFRERNQTGNKLGGTRTNFWSSVAQSVQSPVARPGNIVVPISHPAIAQKVFGGTITAKKAKNLAIPIHPKAHGKSPRVFPALQFAMNSAGVKMLFLNSNRNAKGQFLKGTTMQVYYILKPSVTQAPDPNALPKDAAVGEAMTRAGDIYLRARR
jgi:hypothetical protein